MNILLTNASYARYLTFGVTGVLGEGRPGVDGLSVWRGRNLPRDRTNPRHPGHFRSPHNLRPKPIRQMSDVLSVF